MGDLSSGCGCGCGGNNHMENGFDCCSIIWILLLLSIFCGGSGCGGNFLGGCGCNDGCEGNGSCMWLILILLFCCGGNGFGFGNNCGCGCDRNWNNNRCGDSCGC